MFKKWIAALLCLSITLTSLPLTAYAETLEDEFYEEEYQQEIVLDEESLSTGGREEEEYSDQVVAELEEERDRTEKRFLMEDGTTMAVQYRHDIHYEDDEGNFQEINNNLTLVQSDGKEKESYENIENEVQFNFYKDSDSGELVKVTKDQYELLMRYDGQTEEMQTIAEEEPVSLLKSAAKKLMGQQEPMDAANIQSDVVFENVEKQVDIEYNLIGTSLKEYIIISSKMDEYVFSFKIDMKNLKAKLISSGEVNLYDKKTDELVFQIPRPFMFDSDKVYSSDVHYEIKEQTDEGLVLEVIADKDWINDKERVFPVTIDPIIETNLDPKKILDTFVASNFYQSDIHTWGDLVVGYENTYKTCRTYMQFNNLPTLRPGDVVVDAILRIFTTNYHPYAIPVYSNSIVGLHEVTSSWASNGLRWSNQPSFDSRAADYREYAQSDTGRNRNFDMTRLVQKWYNNPSTNNGIVLKSYNERTSDSNAGSPSYGDYVKISFNSVDDTQFDDSRKPLLSIRYMNSKGLEEHYTYHDFDLGQAGTGYINDYTGILIYSFTDLEYSGNRMPLTLEHYHDTNTANIGFGTGWRTNLSQTIADLNTTGSAVDKALYNKGFIYRVTDGDGTEIYFVKKNATEFIDELGMGLTLKKEGSQQVLEDKDGNKAFFTGNDLVELQDSELNSLKIERNSSRRITKITDGSGRFATLEYSNNLLSAIVDPAGRRTTYTYSGTNLWKVTRPDGSSIYFGYSNGLLTWARGSDNGEALVFGRPGNTYGKVTNIAYYNNTTVNQTSLNYSAANMGQSMKMEYKPYATIFTTSGKDDRLGTSDDISTQYSFDFDGRTASVNSYGTSTGEDYGSENYAYTAKSTSAPQKNNKITYQASGGGYANNIIRNASLEDTRDWNQNQSSYDTSQSYYGNRSMKVTSNSSTGVNQTIQYLSGHSGGTYTISAYVKTQNITGAGGAYLSLYYKDANGVEHRQSSQTLTGTTNTDMENGWTRISFTATLPSNINTAQTVQLSAGIDRATGTAWFDGFQMEKGEIANNVNLIENSSFQLDWNQWKNNNATKVSVVTGGRHGKKAARLNGEPKESVQIWQTIPIKGNANDSYIASVWSKGQSSALEGDRRASITIKVNYTDGTSRDIEKHVNTAASWDNWVYTSLAFSVKDPNNGNKVPSAIVYVIRYSFNTTNMLFDSPQLIKDASQSYTYDNDGNPMSVTDHVNKNMSFTYNGNSELVKDINPGLGSFFYSYNLGRKQRLRQSDGNGLTYNYNYDQYGNNTSVRTDSNAIVSGQQYTIRAIDSGNVVSIQGVNPTAGSNIHMNGNYMGNPQLWVFNKVSENVYTISAKQDTTKNIQVSGTANSSSLTLANKGTGDNQKFLCVQFDDGTYNIRPMNALDKSLDVSTADSSKLIIYNTGMAKNNQRFVISPARQVPDAQSVSAASEDMPEEETKLIDRFIPDEEREAADVIQDEPIDEEESTDEAPDTTDSETEPADTEVPAATNEEETPADTERADTSGQEVQSAGGLAPQAAAVETIVSGKYYMIQSADQKKAVNVSAAFIDNGSVTRMYDTHGRANQAWKFVRYSGDMYYLEACHAPGKQLEVKDGSTANNATLCINNKVTLSKQVFKFVKNSDGTYNIQPMHVSGKSLEMGSDQTSLYTYTTDTNKASQKFTLVPIEDAQKSDYIYTPAEYSSDGNYLTKQYSERGTTMSYEYDSSTGLLQSRQNAKGQSEFYEYDAGDRLTSMRTENDLAIQYTYDGNNNLSAIQRNGFTYNYTYDSWGQATGAYVGSQMLQSHRFNTNNGKVNYTEFGNGHYFEPVYDSLNRMVGQKWNGTEQFTWAFDGNGNVVQHKDNRNNIEYGYTYDTLGRLIRSRSNNGYESYVTYNDKNQLTKTVNTILGETKQTSLTYDVNNRVKEKTLQNGGKTTYFYDSLNRMNNQKYEKGSLQIESKTLAYAPGQYENSTTRLPTQMAYYVNGQERLNQSYTHDELGNIRSASGTHDSKKSYSYDSLNQLFYEQDESNSTAASYEYDNGGNLTRATEYRDAGTGNQHVSAEHTYEYGDANWKDKLTRYDGQDITYDAIGNPLQYRDGMSFTWENGRKLASANVNGTASTYSYDSDGIRLKKTVNGVTTKYFTNGGSTILREDRDGDAPIWYLYDASNSIIGLEYNGQTYYFLKNIQEDVLELLDESGSSVVQYTYDSWGKALSINGTLADTLGERNPIRYRSYYYDTETGFYYLNSRYYDPVIKRFINADENMATGQGILGNNMFAYCLNNPINYSDPEGTSGIAIFASIAVALAQAIIIVAIIAAAIVIGWVLGQAISNAINNAAAAQVAPKAKTKAEEMADAERRVKHKVRPSVSLYWAASLGSYGPIVYSPINFRVAVNRMKNGNSIFAYFSQAAWMVAFEAGDFFNPVGPERHSDTNKNSPTYGSTVNYWYHYHASNGKPRGRLNHAHAWFVLF